ncbi:MAG: Gldg family protein [Chloroflexota bacterium]
MTQILAITRKELSSYFGSPMALIFVGVFLAAALFSFFWVDTFFARGLADVRPLFRWMPLLLIFLVAALTMRQWSEEEQTGTLEILLTLPVRTLDLILGKFLAVLALVTISLALTFFLPITASSLGNLDWGPVIGGYLAALLLASAYTAIGLFLSSRTNNQIVALILTVVLCGILYLIGTQTISQLAGQPLGDIFRALATGSHFESIERGVVDVRDLIYYLSLTVLFLAANILSLDSKRWSEGEQTVAVQRNAIIAVVLVAVNLILLNVWLYPINTARLDLTQQQEFSLSNTTKDLVSNLPEPLLIRGYFSENSHPLLVPLIPRIRDLLQEYEVAGQGQIQVEILDPVTDPELEAEANQTYGIRPTPFQIAGRYEASVVNAYFDILIRYGDQNEVLNFRDLIEVEPSPNGQIEVRLRNLEYDLTRSLKKVVFGFQSIDAVLATLDQPATLTLLITPDTVPPEFAEATQTIETVAGNIEAESGGKFRLEIINPDDANSPLNRQTLLDNYGIQAFAPALFAPEETYYYLHMILQAGDETQIVFPSLDMTEADIRTAIESGLKRASPGFLKTVGIWQPPAVPTQNPFGQPQQPFSSWQAVSDQLRQEYQVENIDLSLGQVPANIDVLLVIAPKQLTDRDRYAIDQYLMRGGSAIIAGGNFLVNADQFSGQLIVEPIEGGLQEMLSHYGVDIQTGMVLDTQNEPFPVPVVRNAGGFQVQEYQSINYPFFVDVRGDGMSEDNAVVSGLPAITLNWVSPLVIDEAKNAERMVTTLLQSTDRSWLRTDINLQPDLDLYPDQGFPIGEEQQSYPLAVAIQGNFDSFFKDKPNPLDIPLEANPAQPAAPPATDAPTVNIGTIERSPESARLIVVGSADFLNDAVFNMTFGNSLNSHLNQLQFVQNAVDWSVEDLDLLEIRARGTRIRLLDPLDSAAQTSWEYFNYVVALIALVGIGFIWHMQRNNEQPMILPKPDAATPDDTETP